jgi:tRNA A58 N-methylase Trm61
MAKDAELVVYCPTCEQSREVMHTMGELHVLKCGHTVQRQGQ